MFSTLRGHTIVWDETLGTWFFLDTGEPTVETHKTRPCGCCGLQGTPEGHDACLGTLPGVINACCGHGDPGAAYVQFLEAPILRGEQAIQYFRHDACKGAC